MNLQINIDTPTPIENETIKPSILDIDENTPSIVSCDITTIKSILPIANQLLDSKLIVDKEDNKAYFLYNIKTTKESKIDLGQTPTKKSFIGLRLAAFENTKDILDTLFNDSLNVYIKYIPFSTEKFITNDVGGVDIYNKYNSPHNYFAKLEQPNIPDCYSFFFNNLIENKESRDQVVDWMAASLKGKLQTILVAIGHQGIGKTIAATILSLCHLSQNAKITNALSLKEKFNAILANKTFICFNEVKLKTEESIERIKELTDKEISVRRMNKDLVVEDNLCNYMMITNEEDGINIKKEDRRFKVVDLTTIPMNRWDLSSFGCPLNDGVYEPQKFVDQLFNAKNIEMLFNYLIKSHKETTNPNKNFFGVIMEDVESASLETYVSCAYNEILDVFATKALDKEYNYTIDDLLLRKIKTDTNLNVKKFTVYKKLRENFHGKKITFTTRETTYAGKFEFVSAKQIKATAEIKVHKDKQNNYIFSLINPTKEEQK